MYQKINPLFLICETQMHVGSGDDLGIVDLPIQRERHTGYPKIEASSLKGALREACEFHFIENADEGAKKTGITKVNRIFGFDAGELPGFTKEDMRALVPEDEKDFAGCIGFSDGRILLFPVKSVKGVFAWITCPSVLKQLEKDMRLSARYKELKIEKLPEIADGTVVLAGKDTNLMIGEDNIVLEEYSFKTTDSPVPLINGDELGGWISENLFSDSMWENKIKQDVVILSDNDFSEFVALSTEVITRTKIDNKTGTVAAGALFTEEYLPTDSVMYSMVLTSPENKAGNRLEENEVSKFIGGILEGEKVIQIGGNATLGKGLTRVIYST